jgi:hypothetical protein
MWTVSSCRGQQDNTPDRINKPGSAGLIPAVCAWNRGGSPKSAFCTLFLIVKSSRCTSVQPHTPGSGSSAK